MPCPTYRISILGRARETASAVGAASYGSGNVLKVKSMLAAASYLSGEPMVDQQLGKTFDYSSRDDVRHTEILAPAHAPAWVHDRERLWNEVEKRESRVNSQLARSLIIALPRELTLEQNVALLREHLQEQFVSKGMTVDWAIHEIPASDGMNQPHAHCLVTLRGFNADGTWEKNKNREWNGYNVDKEWDAKGNPIATTRRFDAAEQWRAAWEKTQNAHLEDAGTDAQISMKSYVRQGIDKIAQIHRGPNLSDMERKGQTTDKGDYNRMAKQRNTVMDAVKGWFKRFLDKDKDKAQQPKREYTIDDIKAYYARLDAAQSRIDEPSVADMEKTARQEREAKREREQAGAGKKREAQHDAPRGAGQEQPPRPRRVASPEDREHYARMRPYLQNFPDLSRQDMLRYIAVTSRHMHQQKAEARRDPFDRLAGTRDTYRFRAVWQDRPVPTPGKERSRGGRER